MWGLDFCTWRQPAAPTTRQSHHTAVAPHGSRTTRQSRHTTVTSHFAPLGFASHGVRRTYLTGACLAWTRLSDCLWLESRAHFASPGSSLLWVTADAFHSSLVGQESPIRVLVARVSCALPLRCARLCLAFANILVPLESGPSAPAPSKLSPTCS